METLGTTHGRNRTIKTFHAPCSQNTGTKNALGENLCGATLKMIQIRDDNLGEEFLKHLIEDTP